MKKAKVETVTTETPRGSTGSKQRKRMYVRVAQPYCARLTSYGSATSTANGSNRGRFDLLVGGTTTLALLSTDCSTPDSISPKRLVLQSNTFDMVGDSEFVSRIAVKFASFSNL